MSVACQILVVPASRLTLTASRGNARRLRNETCKASANPPVRPELVEGLRGASREGFDRPVLSLSKGAARTKYSQGYAISPYS